MVFAWKQARERFHTQRDTLLSVFLGLIKGDRKVRRGKLLLWFQGTQYRVEIVSQRTIFHLEKHAGFRTKRVLDLVAKILMIYTIHSISFHLSTLIPFSFSLLLTLLFTLHCHNVSLFLSHEETRIKIMPSFFAL